MSFNIIGWLRGKRKGAKYLWRTGEVRGTEPNELPVAQYAVYNESSGSAKSAKIDERIEVKPKDVVKEVLCKDDEVKLDFTNLKEKIKAVEKRRDFMKEDLGLSTQDEDKALDYLRAKLALTKNKNAKTLFPWHITTTEKIMALCNKYKVSQGTLSGYKRCVPQEALDAIEKYLKAYKLVSKRQPIFMLIVDVGGAEAKKDPIIYVDSPFGNYFYVLGAWDKEVEIIDELFLWK